MFRKRDTHIHFVGIGGIGMSGIAEVLVNLGYRVTGTDLRESDATRRLEGLGAAVHRGHAAAYLGDADVVVTSSAVGPENPEVIEARERHIPVIPRAEMLAELMRLKQGIAVAGSHGKTTTTSLISYALHEAGIDPTVVIGGKLNAFDSTARLGFGDVIVAEADESDGSFLFLSPTLAVITNIDREHMDHYGDFEDLLDAFVGFANRVPFYGMAVVCADDPHVRAVLPRLTKRTVTYGCNPDADYVAADIRHKGPITHFRVRARGQDQGPFELHMPGTHNVLNALATIAICDEQQVPVEITRAAIAGFEGVQRRFTIRGEASGVLIVDDYGHHPTEIRATLEGARAGYPDRRLVAVVQPHRYTRLRDHFDGFAASLDGCDAIYVTGVYAAGESPIDGFDGERLAQALRDRDGTRELTFIPEVAELASALATRVRAGDLVITLGAGNITQVSHALVEHLS